MANLLGIFGLLFTCRKCGRGIDCEQKMMADDIRAHVGSTDVTTTIFNHSGHSPMFNEPIAFWESVDRWVVGH